MIYYNAEEQSFHLATESTSYIIGIHKGAYPLHLYWGARVYGNDAMWTIEAPYRRLRRYTEPEPDSVQYTKEFFSWEYPDAGTGDYRPAAFGVRDANGDRIADARYAGYEILSGKPALKGLPACYAEAGDKCETLVIHMKDALLQLEIDLYYSVLEEYDAIARHTEFRFSGERALYLTSALSVSLDAPQGFGGMLQLSGSALREKHIVRRELKNGQTAFGSTRGISSHQQTPFCALVNAQTTENAGEAYGVSLVYSGNFLVRADVDAYGSTRVQAGIHPDTFEWELNGGDVFTTPEAILVYSGEGLSGMSRTYHRLFRSRLARGEWRDRERPVLLNTWEACYFDFTHDRVVELAKKAKQAGIELLVMDDGWFGHRDNDRSSLGDWYVNTAKLPGGLKALADDVNALGLKLGIWFEPEMISPDSDLYRAHPDWCVHVEGRKRSEWRSQLVLDLTRDDVCGYIIDSLTKVLSSANIEYVKWDNNRRITEPGSDLLPASHKGEFYHRYMLGLYRVLETLTARFPHILWENCASGGARFDPGMMHYFSQNWASDDTDATARLKIQYGSSVLMPPVWITSHISAVPNHQLERISPMEYREHAAMPFNMGYELNLLQLSDAELGEMREQVERCRRLRGLVQFGEFTRLVSPFDTPYCAWQTASEDGGTVLVWFYKPVAEPEEAYIRVYPAGLDEKAVYRDARTGRTWNGAMLMHMGLPIDWRNGDCFSQMWELEKIRS